jgi:hypothetical protein
VQLGDGVAGLQVGREWTGRVTAALDKHGVVGPIIRYPVGDVICLVACRHTGNPALFAEAWPDIDHLGPASMIALPPTRLGDDPERQVAWQRHPQPSLALPDCETTLTLILNLIRDQR